MRVLGPTSRGLGNDWKCRGGSGHGSAADGYSLIEFLIYIAVFAVVLGIAFGAFYRCLDSSRDLTRQTEMILQALNAGEKWRADVRQASASPRLTSDSSREYFEIPSTNGLVVYSFADGSLWRRAPDGDTKEFLKRVKASAMSPDARAKVTAWRWDLEMLVKKKTVRIRPLFTFEAVPGS